MDYFYPEKKTNPPDRFKGIGLITLKLACEHAMNSFENISDFNAPIILESTAEAKENYHKYGMHAWGNRESWLCFRFDRMKNFMENYENRCRFLWQLKADLENSQQAEEVA